MNIAGGTVTVFCNNNFGNTQKRVPRFVFCNAVIFGAVNKQNKVGVLLEVGCANEGTTQKDLFKEVVKDITLHIAACNPQFRVREDVTPDLIKSEREIYAKQVENKPANIVQKIVDGYQVEMPDNWLDNGNLWEIARPDQAVEVHFGGTVQQFVDGIGRTRYRQTGGFTVEAVPYEMPVLGYDSTRRMAGMQRTVYFRLSCFSCGYWRYST